MQQIFHCIISVHSFRLFFTLCNGHTVWMITFHEQPVSCNSCIVYSLCYVQDATTTAYSLRLQHILHRFRIFFFFFFSWMFWSWPKKEWIHIASTLDNWFGFLLVFTKCNNSCICLHWHRASFGNRFISCLEMHCPLSAYLLLCVCVVVVAVLQFKWQTVGVSHAYFSSRTHFNTRNIYCPVRFAFYFSFGECFARTYARKYIKHILHSIEMPKSRLQQLKYLNETMHSHMPT